MSQANPFVALILEAYEKIEIAKRIAVAGVAFFVYDLLITLDAEIKYVWKSKWSFGRTAFHFNRVWSIVVLCVYIPMIFSHNMDLTTCRRVITFYGYGVIFLILNTTIVMSLRVWILFNRNRYVLVGLSSACLAALVGCIVVFHFQLEQMTQIRNPVPELITGCLTILPRRLTQVPYLIGLTLDTTIFLVTVWRTWALNQSGVRLPIIQCLVRDGAVYYFINCASLATSVLLGLDNNLNNIALGSGYIIPLHSTLCARILLSLHVFNDESKSTMEKTSSTARRDLEWTLTETVGGGTTGARPDSPVELEILKR